MCALQSSAPSPSASPPVLRPAFTLRWPEWVAYAICVTLVTFLYYKRLDWNDQHFAYSFGSVMGAITALFIFSALPAWVVWRLSSKTLAARATLYTLLAVLTFGQILQAKKQASAQFARDIREATNSARDSANLQPLVKALEKEASSPNANAAAAGVMAEMAKELQAKAQKMAAAIQAAQSLPELTPGQTALYDQYLAADEAIIVNVTGMEQTYKNRNVRLEEIIRQKNVPGLQNAPMLVGFREGMDATVPISLEIFAEMKKSFATERSIVSLLKANDGHWRSDPSGHRLFDDPQAQKQYNEMLPAVMESNSKIEALKAKLLQMQQAQR